MLLVFFFSSCAPASGLSAECHINTSISLEHLWAPGDPPRLDGCGGGGALRALRARSVRLGDFFQVWVTPSNLLELIWTNVV